MLVWKLSLPSRAAVHPHRICYSLFRYLGHSVSAGSFFIENNGLRGGVARLAGVETGSVAGLGAGSERVSVRARPDVSHSIAATSGSDGEARIDASWGLSKRLQPERDELLRPGARQVDETGQADAAG